MTAIDLQEWPTVIGGVEREGGGAQVVRASPGHDLSVASFRNATETDVDEAVDAAQRSFDLGVWSSRSGAERAELLQRVARRIESERDSLARIETLESGKPISQARDEMSGSAGLWNYAATLARHCHGDAFNNLGPQYLAVTVKEPIGVVGMITPWNFPLLIISQKLPFALAAGCSVVVKPSDLTPGTTTRLVQILHEEGMPPGVVNLVHGGGDVGHWLAAHPGTQMTTFTGSTRVGRSVAAAAGEALKKVSLELGGKNPHVIFPDADLDAALEKVVFGAYFNQGECCNAGSRLLVHESIADSFTKRVVERSRDVIVGDPLDETTKVGAMISDHQLGVVADFVESGVSSGARVALGGDRLDTERGRFYSPTVLADVPQGSRVAQEEIFGPVLSVVKFRDVTEAIQITNATGYGLSAGVWTGAIDTALEYVRGARAGTVWVNCFMDGFPELSFGGYGKSGIGRELGPHALDEYVEHKSAIIRTGAAAPSWLGD